MATSGGSIAGTLLTYKKPKVPKYREVNLEGEQTSAINQNIASLPKLQGLASKINEFSSDELLKSLEKMFPGYADMLAKGGDIINQQLSGEIPEDVAKQIQRHSAEKAVGGGYAGSDFAGALEARDLGITSLNITNNALNSASRWLSQVKAGTPQFDFTQMFVTPQQRIQVKLQENAAKFNRDMIKSQVDAMPEAWEAALATLFDNIEEMGSSALMMYAGAGMGGGGAPKGGGGGGGGGGAASTQNAALQNYNYTPAQQQPAPIQPTQPMSQSFGDQYGPGYYDSYSPGYNPNFPSGGGP